MRTMNHTVYSCSELYRYTNHARTHTHFYIFLYTQRDVFLGTGVFNGVVYYNDTIYV